MGELKQDVIQKVKDAADKYARVFVIRVENMRNNKLKEVREEWHHSKFFFGKNKVMAFALGKSETDEYKDNLHRVSGCLRGQRGLLFTNSTKDEVTKWFESYADVDFARTGCVAEQEVALKEGPLEQFTHSMEPQLRELGLPKAGKRRGDVDSRLRRLQRRRRAKAGTSAYSQIARPSN